MCTRIKLNFARLPEINLRAGKSGRIGALGQLLYLKVETAYGGTVCVPTLLCDQTASEFINSAAKIGQHEKLRLF